MIITFPKPLLLCGLVPGLVSMNERLARRARSHEEGIAKSSPWRREGCCRSSFPIDLGIVQRTLTTRGKGPTTRAWIWVPASDLAFRQNHVQTPGVPPPQASPSPVFATTRWTLVLAAGDAAHPSSLEALEELCRRYWFPLYAFIRREGYDADHAQDLTQGFFALLLERNDLAGLVRGEGKFRSFLLKALTHFLINERARANTLKRGGDRVIVSLQEESAENRYQSEPAHGETPEKLFERQWALALMETALRELQAEHAVNGKGRLFAALSPFLSREPNPGEYAALAGSLDLPPGTLAVQVHRLRQRYRQVIRTTVADTVGSPMDVDAEMRHLLEALE